MSNGSGRSGKAGGTRRRVRARPAPVPSASRGRKRPPHPLPRSSSSTPPSMEQALPGRPARSRPCLGKRSRERHKPGVAESCLCREPPKDWAGVYGAGGDSAKRGCFHTVLCHSPQTLYFLFKKKITKNSTQESITFFFSSECYSSSSPYH